MRSTVDQRGDAGVWDVARPARPSQVAGVSMAGFRDRGGSALGQRAIPHPAVTLVVDFGAGALVVEHAAGRRRTGSLVAGLGFGLETGVVRVRGQGFEAVQVRLAPLLTRAILGVSPAELVGITALEDVWGGAASHLAEQLSHGSSWQQRFAVTDAMIAGRHQDLSAVDPEVAWAWHQILASRGRIRVERLATEVGWSRRRLWSRFHSQIGLPPKRAATLVRFDHAAHRLAAGDGAARVAADSGYADQSHLHRDVAAFTGTTPTSEATEPWLAVDEVAWATAGSRRPRSG